MPVGATDGDGVSAEIQFAGVVSDDRTGKQFFLIHPNGGVPVYERLEANAMNKAELCKRLRGLVDALELMPDEFVNMGLPLIRVTVPGRDADGNRIVLMVGGEYAADTDEG
jgi:hypothetical protein